MTGPAMFNDAPVRTDAMIALLRTVQRRLLLLTGAAAVAGIIVGLLLAQQAGLWGALIAAGLGLIFMFTTVTLLRFVAGRGPELLQLVLIGGWIIKMVFIVVLMLWLRQLDFYHRGVFFGTLVVVVLGAVIVEIYTVATSRLPYVDVTLPKVEDDVSSVTTAPDSQDLPSRTDTDRRNRADTPQSPPADTATPGPGTP